MQAHRKALLLTALVAVFAAGSLDPALAKHKHKKSTAHRESSHIVRDYDGTPIIIKGYRPRHATPARTAPVEVTPAEAVPQEPRQPSQRQADRPVHIPRGSSTYIPPVNPSPYSSNSPPARALTQPIVQPYNPPPITTFSDRVTGAIHSYPLERGLGNNPTDQQMYIRQKANQ
jgi:hypothetical protein